MTQHIPQAKLKRIPSREESAQNAAALDEVARSLGFTEAEARPRRWTMRIGALLQQVRSRLRLRQDETAKTAGITQSYLSRLENGLIQKRGPTIDVLLRWAEAADADIEFAVRSKKDGHLLGLVSSKDLDSAVGEGVSPDETTGVDLVTGRRDAAKEVTVIFARDEAPSRMYSRGERERKREPIDPAQTLRQAQDALTRLSGIVQLARANRTFAPNRKVAEGIVESLLGAVQVLWPLVPSSKLPRREAPAQSTVQAGEGDLVVLDWEDVHVVSHAGPSEEGDFGALIQEAASHEQKA